MTGTHDVAAHDQAVTHRFIVHYPEHPARADDPHYVDFNAYHKAHRATARCALGQRLGFDTCLDAQGNPAAPPADGGEQPGLELHHSHVEFSIQNGVDLALLELDYPGISDPTQVGAWVESGDNLIWYCAGHHRGAGGVHNVDASNWEAERYVRDLIAKPKAAP
jgi:hypothetical protein